MDAPHPEVVVPLNDRQGRYQRLAARAAGAGDVVHGVTGFFIAVGRRQASRSRN